jgi:dihydroflavonol-4-reductase
MDGVIFSAGRNWRPGLAPSRYRPQNLGCMRTFFAAVADLDPSPRVVFTSSMSAMAGSLVPMVFTEDSNCQAVCRRRLSPYDRAKVECDRLARQVAAGRRNIVIVYPGYMLGPGASAESRLTTPVLVQWFCLRHLAVYVGRGGHSFCDVRDVARAHVAALEEGAPGSRYILGGDNLDAVAFHRLLSSQTGVPCPRRVRPWFPLAATSVLDAASAVSRGRWQSPLHRQFARALPLYYWGDSSRAQRDLGYACREIEFTIRDTITDLVRRGDLPDEFRYMESMTEENRPALLLLRQLADRHLHREQLLPQLGRILDAARHNHELNRALEELLAGGRYLPDGGRFAWTAQGTALAKLRALLDYAYYASTEFHRKVS